MGKRSSGFAVRLSGVGDGQHKYDFELDQRFFDGFDAPDLDGGRVKAEVIYDKKGTVRKLVFHLEGSVSVLCDRCLDYFEYPVKIKEYLLLKSGETLQDIDEHLIMVPDDYYELDIAQYLYEFIMLKLPLKRIHPDQATGVAGCSREMLEKLNEHRPKFTGSKTENTDPRWNALKDLLDKD